jgi:outer membrane protein assembly factor BamB
LFTHAFQGALFEKQQVVAQFARYEAHPSQVFQLDLASKGATKLYDLPVDALHRHTYAYQTGDLLLVLRPEKEKQDIDYVRTIMDVRDIHNNSTLWSRKLNGRPSFFYTGGKFALLTRNWDNIRAAAKEDPVLQARLQTVDDKHDAYVLQVFDPHSGTHLGSLLVDTGKRSFEVESAYTFGDTVFVGDSENRTLVYSLRTNQQKGALVGSIVAATSTGDRVLIENGDGLTQLFDTTTLQPVTHFNFPSRVVGARFIENGSLMVLTADQSVYQVEPDKGVAAQASGKTPEPR